MGFINRIQNYGLFVKIYRFEQGRGFLMRKDRFNICISFYAVLAFVLAILGQTLLCGMLLGFVIVIQKDEWLTKQVMQAFFLALVESIISCVTNIFSGLYAIPILGIAFSGIVGLISGILSFLLLIIGLIAIGKVSKDSDARIPIASKLANKAFGLTCTIQYKPASDASVQDPDTSNDHKD